MHGASTLPGQWTVFASLLIAFGVHVTRAEAQTKPESTAACPAAADLSHLHLQGRWTATLQAVATAAGASTATPTQSTAVLQLGPHPELAHSVRGTVQRGPTTAVVSGDVDDGDLTLEESVNGTNISATWIGRVVDGSCGKEIRGQWNNANPTPSAPSASFVLRKQPGW